VTLLTKPVDEQQLRKFVEKVSPMGFWKGHNKGSVSERNFASSVFYWLQGTAAIYAAMFGIGYLLRLEYVLGAGLLVIGVVMLVLMVRGMGQLDRQRTVT
jgi:SSS family solute:Na+ symporter